MIKDGEFTSPDKGSDKGVQLINKRKRKAINNGHEMFIDIQKTLQL